MCYQRRREIFRGLGQIFLAGPQKTFIACQTRFSVTKRLIKINSVEGAGPPKSWGTEQLLFLPCHSVGAVYYISKN